MDLGDVSPKNVKPGIGGRQPTSDILDAVLGVDGSD
jgi:hypothetical protein